MLWEEAKVIFFFFPHNFEVPVADLPSNLQVQHHTMFASWNKTKCCKMAMRYNRVEYFPIILW